jgi:hypothetical protein
VSWLPETQVARVLVAGALIAGILVAQVMTLVGVRSNEKVRARIAEALRSMYFILVLTLAMIASSVVFGPGHIHQGAKGAMGTTILGMVFAIVFVTTGTLWVPTVLHALIDARLLPMIDEGQSREPAAQT